MSKDFVPYKESLALKELGFDESCFYCYFPNPNFKIGVKFDLLETNKMLPNQIKNIGELIKDGSFSNTILTPTFSQAFRFFREKYNLHHLDLLSILFLEQKITYEQAELECLRKLIEICKQSK